MNKLLIKLLVFTPHPPQGGAIKLEDFKVPLGGFRGRNR